MQIQNDPKTNGSSHQFFDGCKWRSFFQRFQKIVMNVFSQKVSIWHRGRSQSKKTNKSYSEHVWFLSYLCHFQWTCLARQLATCNLCPSYIQQPHDNTVNALRGIWRKWFPMLKMGHSFRFYLGITNNDSWFEQGLVGIVVGKSYFSIWEKTMGPIIILQFVRLIIRKKEGEINKKRDALTKPTQMMAIMHKEVP